MKLKDRVILIFGGGRGLGRTVALFCAREGARVAVAARSEEDLKETADFVRSQVGGEARVMSVRCDVTLEQEVKDAIAKTEKKFGPIFGLVCAAGIYGSIGPFEETPIDEWIKAIDVNLIGTVRCIQAALHGMKKRHDGRILLFSGGGQGAMPRFSSYVASKGAIGRLTETLGAEFAPHGIYLNAIVPGPVNTRFLDDLLAAGPEKVGVERYEASIEQKQQGGKPPEKAGELAVFLLSTQSIGLYGKTISANYDRYWEIEDPESVSKSDVFAMRRVVSADGATRYPDR